jgi:predicted PurR-regulated permease PerM
VAFNRPAGSRRITALYVLATLALAGLIAYGFVLFLIRIEYVVFILIASIFLLYMINPSVRWLARRMHVGFAVLIVYLVIALLIAVVVEFLVPPLINDAGKFVHGIPTIVAELSRNISDPNNKALAWLPSPVRDYLANLPAELVGFAQQYAATAVRTATSLLFSAAAVVAAIIVVPILTVYILLDQENLVRIFLGFFPERTRPKAKAVLLDLDRVLGGFIRGQIIDAIAVGIMVFIVLRIFHVPYAYLIAVFSAVFQIIPYFGAVVAFFPAVALAWISNGAGSAIGVGLSIIGVHQLDGNVVAPRIMRENVGLTPFWIILSVLAFTELFGFVGTFVAVPSAAMIRVMKMHFLPAPVDREEAKPTRRDQELRLEDEEIANVDGR